MKRSALFGGIVWCALAANSAWGTHVGAQRLGTFERLFLLGPLVVVPLGLELFARLESGAEGTGFVRTARWIQFPAAVLVAASFHIERGLAATALVLPWCCVGCILGFRALLFLISSDRKSLKEVCVIASFFYLPIGCAWLIASRFGLNPMGFQEPIVLLTAVHFHFAGFAAPMMTRAASEVIERTSLFARKIFYVVAAGVLAGPGALAVGFIVGPRMKLAAAILLVASEIGLALFFLAAIRHLQPHWTRVFVALSATSLLGAMVFAGVWAIGEFPLQPFVHLAEMAKFHGTANAMGFTICGLLGWTFAQPETRQQNGAAT